MLRLYRKLTQVKAFLDEIAEEFVDASDVKLIELPAAKNSITTTPEYQIVVKYDCHEFNRLSMLDTASEYTDGDYDD